MSYLYSTLRNDYKVNIEEIHKFHFWRHHKSYPLIEAGSSLRNDLLSLSVAMVTCHFSWWFRAACIYSEDSLLDAIYQKKQQLPLSAPINIYNQTCSGSDSFTDFQVDWWG